LDITDTERGQDVENISTVFSQIASLDVIPPFDQLETTPPEQK
jgi:hypothetical protein